jgi:hypothetical protein
MKMKNKRRNSIEISPETRLKTLYFLLQGLDAHELAVNLEIGFKALKHRLTLIYKFYGVKNRIQLMSLYINIPTRVRKSFINDENKVVTRKKYKTKEQFKENENILPQGLKF